MQPIRNVVQMSSSSLPVEDAATRAAALDRQRRTGFGRLQNPLPWPPCWQEGARIRGQLLRDAADIFEYMTCVIEGEGRGPSQSWGSGGRGGWDALGRRLQLQEDRARAVKLPPIDRRYVKTPEPRLNPVFAEASQDDLLLA